MARALYEKFQRNGTLSEFSPKTRPEHRIGPGMMLAVGAGIAEIESMSFPTATPGMVRWCALIGAVFFAIAATTATVSLINAHRTGVAEYNPSPRTSTSRLTVTR